MVGGDRVLGVLIVGLIYLIEAISVGKGSMFPNHTYLTMGAEKAIATTVTTTTIDIVVASITLAAALLATTIVVFAATPLLPYIRLPVERPAPGLASNNRPSLCLESPRQATVMSYVEK
jgi:hypothetical protein